MKNTAIIAFIASVMSLWSCTKEPELDPWENENLTDSTGININVDLIVSGKVDNGAFRIENGKNDYVNQIAESYNGLCTSFGDTIPSYIYMQSLIFQKQYKRERSFYIDLVSCIRSDEDEAESKENMFEVGYYPLLNLADTAYGAHIRFIDSEGVLWSSMKGPNDMVGHYFQLSGVIENDIDDFSTRIAFGRFNCFLYNSEGEILEFNNFNFKSRLGTF